jgi:hypothetical protein
MPNIISCRANKIEQFQKCTGADVATAIAYLEAEEFILSYAVETYRCDLEFHRENNIEPPLSAAQIEFLDRLKGETR